MANKERGEVELKAGDETFVLRFNTNAICSAETALDMGVNEIGRRISNAKDFRLGHWRVLLWAALLDQHKGVDIDEAGRIMDAAGQDAAVAKVGEAIALGQQEATEGGNPRKASQ